VFAALAAAGTSVPFGQAEGSREVVRTIPLADIPHKSTRQLEDAIRLYLATSNASAKPFVWTKTADEILVGIARFLLEHLQQHRRSAPAGRLIRD